MEELKEHLSPERVKLNLESDNSETVEEYEKNLWEDLMSEVDKNHDGKVCYVF